MCFNVFQDIHSKNQRPLQAGIPIYNDNQKQLFSQHPYVFCRREVNCLRYILALTIAVIAAVMDLYSEKIANWCIYLFWILGLGYQIGFLGMAGIWLFLKGAFTPIIILFGLFVFRMLGPGDIKLLSALGGIMGITSIMKCILFSFLIGAVLSAAFIAVSGNLRQRLWYFTDYIIQFINTKKITPYYKPGRQIENIHFGIPVLLSVMLYAGGFY